MGTDRRRAPRYDEYEYGAAVNGTSEYAAAGPRAPAGMAPTTAAPHRTPRRAPARAAASATLRYSYARVGRPPPPVGPTRVR